MLKEITIPYSVERLYAYDTLSPCKELEKVVILNPDCIIPDYKDIISNDDDGYSGEIYGYDNSTAQAYAEKYGYSFVSLGARPVITTTVTTEATTTIKTTVTTVVSTTSKQTTSTEKQTTTVAFSTWYLPYISTSETTTALVTTAASSTVSNMITSVTTTAPPVLIGDSNSDNKLNVLDCTYIARMLAQRKGAMLPDTADFNKDGKVNIMDAMEIAKILAKKHKK